jgi:hypothetical protein
VSYVPTSSEDASGDLKFVLPRSLIFLNRKDAKDQATMLSATAVPTDGAIDGQPLPVYALTNASSWAVTTHLNITYIDNSRIISSIGVSVEDNRVKTIGEIAGVITTVVKAAAVLGPQGGQGPDMPDRLPAVIDPQAYASRPANAPRWLVVPRNESIEQDPDNEWVYRLNIDQLPKDAMPAKTFFDKYATKTDLFPYSACRDATLYVLKSKKGASDEERDKGIGKAFVFGLKIADPSSVMLVRLPTKGKIDVHSACGVNVTSEKSDTSSAWSILGEIGKQAASIKKAYDDEAKAKK